MSYSISNIEEYKWNYKYLLEHRVDILQDSVNSLIADSEKRVNSFMDELEAMKKNDQAMQDLPERYKQSYESQIYYQYDEIAKSIKVNSRYGIILTIHSNLESICRDIIKQLNKKSNVTDFEENEDFFSNFKNFLKLTLSISNSEYQKSYNKICSFHKIRNFIAHGNGWVHKDKKDGLGPVDSIFQGISIENYNSDYYKIEITDSSFLNDVNNAASTFINKVGNLIEENYDNLN